jgi:hypothetical protein
MMFQMPGNAPSAAWLTSITSLAGPVTGRADGQQLRVVRCQHAGTVQRLLADRAAEDDLP